MGGVRLESHSAPNCTHTPKAIITVNQMHLLENTKKNNLFPNPKNVLKNENSVTKTTVNIKLSRTMYIKLKFLITSNTNSQLEIKI
jgi:hypothetical protein